VSLATPEKIRKLQRALYVKAKQEPTRRFHFLYDKVWREDILAHAYACCRANGGAPGVDGETFTRIESYGVKRWLDELREEVRTARYKPQPVRRVMIPKASGVGQRPLGIPPIRDRVVQTAALLVLEPIFEADFDEAAYGYRPKRSALDAVRTVHQAIDEGHTEIVDADLSRYFDTIPHSALITCVARRISDGKMLHLIQMWLKAPVEETDEPGHRRMSGGKKACDPQKVRPARNSAELGDRRDSRVSGPPVQSFRMRRTSSTSTACWTAGRVLADVLSFLSFGFRSRSQLAAENLFLRKQLALYTERGVRARRADDATRITLVVLAYLIDWRAALTIVTPETLIRWHRKGFRLFWRWKSKARGRPRLPVDVRDMIAAMACANATWGEERIATELRLKLGIRVSPPDGAAIHAARRTPARSPVVARVEHFRAKPCGGCARVRFLRGDHGDVPDVVRLHRPGGRHAAYRPLERDRASDRRLDGPAVPRDCAR
jgi:Reverse transcriptase (RNA-dependent DNA polymerase)